MSNNKADNQAGARTQNKLTALETVRKWETEQAASYAVIIDGNTHCFYRDETGQHQGKQTQSVRTTRGVITVAKCQEIIAKVEAAFGIKVRNIKVMMTDYDYSSIRTEEDAEYVLSGDIGVDTLVDKTATYNVAANCLQIWSGGMPIYENNNGAICRDADALADCLC